MQANKINKLQHAIADFTTDDNIAMAAEESEFMVDKGKQFISKVAY